MIELKSAQEISLMREAGRVVAQVFSGIEDMIVPGVSTKSIDQRIDEIIRSHGAYPSFLGYEGHYTPFPASSCISVDDVIVHGIPSKGQVLTDGMIVSIDVGAELNGYHGDACRTFIVGETLPAWRKLVEVTEASFWAGLEQAVAGKRIGDISSAVQTYCEARGYGVVRELTGHGIGRRLHEKPDLPNFGRAGRGVRLAVGMTLALEPMITLGSPAVIWDPDGWTVRTADGSPAAHYENTFVITDDGPVILTAL